MPDMHPVTRLTTARSTLADADQGAFLTCTLIAPHANRRADRRLDVFAAELLEQVSVSSQSAAVLGIKNWTPQA